jgi:hypothetical protein
VNLAKISGKKQKIKFMIKIILNNPIFSILVGIFCGLLINILKGVIKGVIKGNFSWQTLIKGSTFKIWSLVILAFCCTYYWGVYKGNLSKPLNWQANYQDEIYFNIPNGSDVFWKPKNSNKAYWIDKSGKKRLVTQGDIKELTVKLKPWGLMLEPCYVATYGISNVASSVEGGIGLKYARFKRWNSGVSITSGGFFPLDLMYNLTDNTAVGVGTGMGFKKGERKMFDKYHVGLFIKI